MTARPPGLAAQLDEARAERQVLWRSVVEGTHDAPQDLLAPSRDDEHAKRHHHQR